VRGQVEFSGPHVAETELALPIPRGTTARVAVGGGGHPGGRPHKSAFLTDGAYLFRDDVAVVSTSGIQFFALPPPPPHLP
jgi:hypothetical protein